MTFLDQASLVLHVLAAVGLVGGGIVQVMAGTRLRSAGTSDTIATWARFTRSAGPLLIGSAAISLMTGGHMAGAVWTTEATSGFSYPFITIGAIALVILAPVGPMMGGAQLRRLAADADGDAPAELLAARARSAKLWGPVHSLVGVGAGLVVIMSAKPASWAATVLIVVAGFAVGWLSGVLVANRRD